MQHAHASGQVILSGSTCDIGAKLFDEISPPVIQALRAEGVKPEQMIGFFEGVITAVIDAQAKECGVETCPHSLERVIMAFMLKNLCGGFEEDDAATPDEKPPAAPTQPTQPEQPATQG